MCVCVFCVHTTKIYVCVVENIFCVHTTNNEDVLCGVENIFCVHTTNNEDVLCGVENIFCVHTTNNWRCVVWSRKYILCTHN